MTIHRPMRTTTAKTVVSLLCLALFVFLQALAASPSLHRCLHHDADQIDHHCAVTLISQGNLHASAAGPGEAVLPAAYFFLTLTASESIHAPIDYLLLPGRAPPASLLG